MPSSASAARQHVRVLTAEQRAEFDRNGILKIEGVFSAAEAARMQEAIWGELRQRHGILRDDPATWSRHPPTGLKSSKRHRSFAPVFGPGLGGALDDLFGAEGWIQPKHAGQVLVTMPGATEWRVPHHLWHVDFQYTLPPERLVIVKCWALVDDLEPGGGATPQIAGSHRLVANFVAGRTGAELDFRRTRMAFMRSQPWLKALATDDDDPDRNERFMTETDVDGVPVRVVELTGAAGTVYITHPWVLHSLAPNTRKTPRLMRSFPIRQNGATTDASLSRTEYG